MGLKGSTSQSSSLKRTLRTLPVTVAASVARRASPALTQFTAEAFASRQTVYGDARPSSATGAPLSLVKSGATRDALRFVTVGTIIRCVLPTRWAKYLIGKYGILPNGALPVRWSRELGKIVATTEPPP